MKRSGLIAIVVLVLMTGSVSYAYIGGIYPSGPRLVTYCYLQALAAAYNLNFEGHLGKRTFSPPVDSETSITTPEVFSQILEEVANMFEGRIYSFERLIVEINAELYNKRRDIKEELGLEIIGEGGANEIRSRLEAYVEERLGSRIDELLATLGVDGSQPVEITRLGVYPVVSVPDLCLATNPDRNNQSYKVHTINTTIRGVVMDWVIGSWLSGFDPAVISNILDTINFLLEENPVLGDGERFSKSFKEAISYYSGEELDFNNPEHLMALLNIGMEIALGGIYTPWDLVRMGAEEIVDQAEAYFNQEFYTPPSIKGQETPDTNIELAEKVYEFSGMKIYLTRRVLELLNETNYYGRELDLNNSYDAGLVDSFVSRFYAVLREENYNPASRQWDPTPMSIDEALGLIEFYISVAQKIKPHLEEAYGRIPLLETGYQAEEQRRILSQWAEIGYRFVRYGGMSAEEAVNAARQLLPKRGDKWEEIVDLIAKRYEGFEEQTADQVRADYSQPVEQWYKDKLVDEYNGMVSSLYEVAMKWSPMFGLQGEVDVENAIEVIDDMLIVANEAGLPRLVKNDYLGISGMYDLKKGERSGKYMFWAQVLYSMYKKTGDLQKARDYVYLQLKARQLVREKARIFKMGINPRQWDGFSALENLLEGDLSNLNEVVDAASRLRDPIKFSDLPYIVEEFTEPQVHLWPVTPEEAEGFEFPLIREEAVELLVNEGLITSEEVQRFRDEGLITSATTGLSLPEEDTGFATVPPQEPVADLNFGDLL